MPEGQRARRLEMHCPLAAFQCLLIVMLLIVREAKREPEPVIGGLKDYFLLDRRPRFAPILRLDATLNSSDRLISETSAAHRPFLRTRASQTASEPPGTRPGAPSSRRAAYVDHDESADCAARRAAQAHKRFIPPSLRKPARSLFLSYASMFAVSPWRGRQSSGGGDRPLFTY